MIRRTRASLSSLALVIAILGLSVQTHSQAKSSVIPVGPQLLRDFSLGTESSDPSGLFPFGNLLLFFPFAPGYDHEPWVTDGTLAGTKILKNINTAGSSLPSFQIMNHNLVFFSAVDPATGNELWVTDGTPAGTQFVTDLADGALSSEPHAMVSLGDFVYFIASPSGESGVFKLFRSDGTGSNTKQVSEFELRADTLGVYHQQVYFLASNNSSGIDLWRTASNGAELVKQVCAVSCNETWYPTKPDQGFVILNDELYFGVASATHTELWKTDGSSAETVLIKQFDLADRGVDYLTPAGNWLYFSGYRTDSGRDLWRTDGTGANTQIIKDCSSDPFNGSPIDLTAIANDVYFVTRHDINSDPAGGGTLWKWDAASEQAVDVFDSVITPPNSLTVVNNILYFTAPVDAVGGAQLFRTTGAPSQTVNLNIAASSLTAWKGGLAFAGRSELYGNELWFTDNSDSGIMLFDLNTTKVDTDFKGGAFFQGGLYFTVQNELWVSNGNPTETMLLTNNYTQTISPFFSDSFANGVNKIKYLPPSDLNNEFYFFVLEGLGYQLWKTGGTPESTVFVADLDPNVYETSYGRPVKAGDFIYFYQYQAPTNENRIWRSDGTSDGTQILISEPNTQFSYGIGSQLEITALNETIIAKIGNKFYRSTGSGDLENFADVAPNTSIYGLALAGGYLYFSMGSQLTYYQLYRTDGETIQEIDDSVSGLPLTNIADNISIGGVLYTSAIIGSSAGLWKLNPGSTDAELVKTFSVRNQPKRFASLNEEYLFFQVQDGHQNGTIWVSDGTEAGTHEFCPSCGFTKSGDFMTAWRGKMYFTATDANHGAELWITDGTEGGTHLYADIRPGPESSTPLYLDSSETTLFFSADDGIHGREPWGVYLADSSSIYFPLVSHE